MTHLFPWHGAAAVFWPPLCWQALHWSWASCRRRPGRRQKQLVIGGTAGSNIDQLQYGIVPILQKKGYKVRLVEFNDYVQPNLALADGSLDANFFQHEVYFNQFKGDRKLDLTALVQGPIAPMGVYSKQRKSLAELKEGDRIALPNDASNLARGILLQQAGLVKLKEV